MLPRLFTSISHQPRGEQKINFKRKSRLPGSCCVLFEGFKSIDMNRFLKITKQFENSEDGRCPVRLQVRCSTRRFTRCRPKAKYKVKKKLQPLLEAFGANKHLYKILFVRCRTFGALCCACIWNSRRCEAWKIPLV